MASHFHYHQQEQRAINENHFINQIVIVLMVLPVALLIVFVVAFKALNLQIAKHELQEFASIFALACAQVISCTAYGILNIAVCMTTDCVECGLCFTTFDRQCIYYIHLKLQRRT